jgi:alkylhydroperoxidase family enzyme
MARLPYLGTTDVAAGDQDLLENAINFRRALVNSPNCARAQRQMMEFIRFKSRLDPRLREMAILQIGYLARSRYEYAHHIELARQFGVSDDDIRAVAADTDGKPTHLDPLTRAVLRAARELTRDVALADETFAALKQGLDNERLVDLFCTIGSYNSVIRMLAAMQIDVEPDGLAYLEEFPLPPS